MSSVFKTLLVLEVAVCFGSTVFYLLLGLILVPHQLNLLMLYGTNDAAPPAALYEIGAALGLLGVVMLMRRLFADDPATGTRWLIVSLLAVGALAVASGPYGVFAIAGWSKIPLRLQLLLAGMPLACMAHLVYLARGFLLGSPR